MGRRYRCIQFNLVLSNVNRYSYEILVGPCEDILIFSEQIFHFYNYQKVHINVELHQLWLRNNAHIQILDLDIFL
jgi:hypothetical protein